MPSPRAVSDRFQQVPARVPKSSPTGSRAKRLKLVGAFQGRHSKSYSFREPTWVPNLYRSVHGPTYFFERQNKGRKIREGLGRDFSVASKRAVEINRQIEHGDYFRNSTTARRLSVSQYLSNFQTSLSNRSPKTVASYRNRSNQFLTYLSDHHGSTLRVLDLTEQIAQGYFDWRSRQLVARSGRSKPTTPRAVPCGRTVQDDLVVLRTVFRAAVDQGIISRNPFSKIRLHRKPGDDVRRPQPLTEDQAKRLLKAAGEYDKATNVVGKPSSFRGMMRQMIHLYLLTGLRKEELIHLPWNHVDLTWGQYGLIHIKPIDIELRLQIRLNGALASGLSRLARTRKAEATLFPNLKCARSLLPERYVDQEADSLMRLGVSSWDESTNVLAIPTRIAWRQKATQGSVPLVKAARKIIEERRKADPDGAIVFPHPDGGVLRSDPLPEFKKIAKNAGLPSTVYIHDLRHTFGFTLRDREVPLETIMGLMRHKNIEDTMIYARYSDQQGARGISNLDGFAC